MLGCKNFTPYSTFVASAGGGGRPTFNGGGGVKLSWITVSGVKSGTGRIGDNGKLGTGSIIVGILGMLGNMPPEDGAEPPDGGVLPPVGMGNGPG